MSCSSRASSPSPMLTASDTGQLNPASHQEEQIAQDDSVCLNNVSESNQIHQPGELDSKSPNLNATCISPCTNPTCLHSAIALTKLKEEVAHIKASLYRLQAENAHLKAHQLPPPTQLVHSPIYAVNVLAWNECLSCEASDETTTQHFFSSLAKAENFVRFKAYERADAGILKRDKETGWMELEDKSEGETGNCEECGAAERVYVQMAASIEFLEKQPFITDKDGELMAVTGSKEIKDLTFVTGPEGKIEMVSSCTGIDVRDYASVLTEHLIEKIYGYMMDKVTEKLIKLDELHVLRSESFRNGVDRVAELANELLSEKGLDEVEFTMVPKIPRLRWALLCSWWFQFSSGTSDDLQSVSPWIP